MKKINLIGLTLLIAVIISGCTNNTKTTNNEIKNPPIQFEAISTGTTDLGDVAIELTPKEVLDGKLEVRMSMNTHSVDLSQFDLKQITTLEYNGEKIKPNSAPTLSGHHNSGLLIFDVGKDINTFTINIKGVPKVNNRVFQWSNKVD